MKSIIQKSLVIALMYYAVAIVGCTRCKCNPVKNGTFKYTEIKATNLNFLIKGDSLFSAGISTSDTISKDSFGIRAEFLYEVIAAKSSPSCFNLMNAVYACDCASPSYTNIDPITSISLITLNDFDATHLAGSVVNDYFKTLDYTYSPQKITYNDLLFNGSTYYNDLYHGNGFPVTDLYLTKPVNKIVAFEIVVKYLSGTTMSNKTKPVFLK